MARRKRTVKTIIVRNNQQQAKSRPARRRRNQRRVNRSGLRGAMSRQQTAVYVQSLQDPWRHSACIPDGANGVGCFSVKETVLLGTGAGGGAAALILNPNSPVNHRVVDTGSTATTPTISGNYASAVAVTSIQALYSEVRTVSAGIKMRYVGNTQTDQGILLIGQVSANQTPSAFNGASLTQAQALFQNYKLFPLRSGSTVTWRPQCMDDASAYSGISGSVAAVTAAPTAPYLVALIYGATASTTSLAVADIVVNYEGQYKQQTFLPGGVDATPTKAEPGWYESALNVVRQLDPIMPFVQSTMVNAFNSPMASTAMGMLLGAAGQRGLPRLQNAGYMQVD